MCISRILSGEAIYNSRPNTFAGIELYELAKELLKVKSEEEANDWAGRFGDWMIKYKDFLSEMTVDENGNKRPTHERLIKAERSLIRLLKENTLFTYLDDKLSVQFKVPSTNNRIEGGVNAQLRDMLLGGFTVNGKPHTWSKKSAALAGGEY